MKKHLGFLTVSFLLISSLGGAQNRCPDDFRYAGTLSGTDPGEFNQMVVLKLPERSTLDTSYQQTEVRATGGKDKKAKSNLRPQDIPKGIHIIPFGSSGSNSWAVSEPKLAEIKEGNNAASPRYAFGMRLLSRCRIPRLPKANSLAM